MKVIAGIDSAKKFQRAKHLGNTRSLIEPFKGYNIYKFYEDRYEDDKEKAAKVADQNELNVNSGGKKIVPKRESEKQGRRVQRISPANK